MLTLSSICYDCQFAGKIQFDKSCEKYMLERNHLYVQQMGRDSTPRELDSHHGDSSYKEKPLGDL